MKAIVFAAICLAVSGCSTQQRCQTKDEYDYSVVVKQADGTTSSWRGPHTVSRSGELLTVKHVASGSRHSYEGATLIKCVYQRR